jgi:hypothetical protein
LKLLVCRRAGTCNAWFRCGVHAEHFAGCGAGVVLIGCPVRGSLVSGPRIDYCDKISKLFVAILSSVVISTSAFAGELTVTGSANASYAINGGQGNDNDKGLGISNELKFAASGELDNGFTWNYFMELDGNDGGAHDNDDSQLAIGMGDMGTLKINDSEGGLSTETGFGIGAVGVGQDFAAPAAFAGHDTDVSGSGNIEYNTAADILPFGIGAKFAYVPNNSDGDNNSYKNSGTENTAGATGDSNMMYQLTASPIDGLNIGADYITSENTTGTNVQEAEAGGWYANYALGNFKVGYGERHSAPGIDGAARINAGAYNYEMKQQGVELAVNDAFSVSYSKEESTRKSYGAAVNAAAGASPFTRTSISYELTSLQAAYDIGGATIGIANQEATNSGYAAGDATLTIVSLAMAF